MGVGVELGVVDVVFVAELLCEDEVVRVVDVDVAEEEVVDVDSVEDEVVDVDVAEEEVVDVDSVEEEVVDVDLAEEVVVVYNKQVQAELTCEGES